MKVSLCCDVTVIKERDNYICKSCLKTCKVKEYDPFKNDPKPGDANYQDWSMDDDSSDK